jgi:serine/threonine protein kinase
MSPEQAEGRRLDARSDIFSFGALLYEMVTGRRAFAGDSPAATLAAVMRGQPQAPRDVAPDVPRDLEKVVLRCLRKQADQRYQSMADVKLELEQIKEDSDSQRSRGRLVHAGVVAMASSWLSRNPAVLVWRLVHLRSAPYASRLRSSCPHTSQNGWEWEPRSAGRRQWRLGTGDVDNDDIHVKMIGPGVHRLTTDPAPDGVPSWSRTAGRSPS